MCGRYELNATPEELERHFRGLLPDETWTAHDYLLSYNIAPSRAAEVIRYSKRDERNALDHLTWGFRPRWANRGWINARDDRLFESPTFREAARRRRCLVPATGWYEWQDIGAKHKQPYYIHFDRVFAFAGIWTARQTTQGWELSFAIITTASRGLAAGIHDRMPLVMPPAHYAAWLDPHTSDPAALMSPFEAGMKAHPVSTFVNDPKNDSEKCIEPLTT